MTCWIPVDIQHVSRGDWRVYVPGPGLFVYGMSEKDAKANLVKTIEEKLGTHDFRVVYRES